MSPKEWLALFGERAERLTADLGDLVARESPSEDPAMVSALAAWIRDRLRERGVAARTEACGSAGDALVAEVGEKAARSFSDTSTRSGRPEPCATIHSASMASARPVPASST